MKNNKLTRSHLTLSFLLVLGLGISIPKQSYASGSIAEYDFKIPLDSIGSEVINGNRFVLHKLEPKETYYQLSRIYGVPVKEIITANSNKNLRVGDTVKIPRGKSVLLAPAVNTREIAVQAKSKIDFNNSSDYTEYKVGKSETLYSISRRFQLKVEDIKKFNNLSSNNLSEGMILKIPSKAVAENMEEPEPTSVLPSLPEIIEENQPIDDAVFKANKYGIREKKERGVGIWLESLKGDGQTSLALHKTAPVGTILKITNPMNQSVTFAKVVGKFGDNEETLGAIVVLSKSAAASVGVLDKKFQVELAYGVPLD